MVLHRASQDIDKKIAEGHITRLEAEPLLSRINSTKTKYMQEAK